MGLWAGRSQGRSWNRALVTGASTGIGRAIAVRLAEAGVHLVITARGKESLEKMAAELRADMGVEVEVLAADLTDPEGLAAVERRVVAEDDPVDLLVNNAGMGYEGLFHTHEPAEVDEMLRLNVIALTRLTHAAVGQMTARGHGQVMLVSSMASLQGLPLAAAYAATKAFITSLGEAVHEELRGSGVVVTTVLPGLTRTDFHQRGRWNLDRWPSVGWKDADSVAAKALAGAARAKAEVVTSRFDQVMAVFSTKVPRGLRRSILGWSARRSNR